MPPTPSRVLPALPHTRRGKRQRLVLAWAMRRGLRGAYHHLDIADVARCGSYCSLRDPASETTCCVRGDRSNKEQHDNMLMCWVRRHRLIGPGVSGAHRWRRVLRFVCLGKYLFRVFGVVGTKCISTFSIGNGKVCNGMQKRSLKEAAGVVISSMYFDRRGIHGILMGIVSSGELRRFSTCSFNVGEAPHK